MPPTMTAISLRPAALSACISLGTIRWSVASDDTPITSHRPPDRAQRLHQLGHDQVVGGKRRHPDHIHVLLHRQLDHRRDVLPGRRVHHLHTRIAREGSDHATAAIVAVETDLGDEYLGWMGRHHALPRKVMKSFI